ncbi:hypothetical protein C8Q78DRAFT_406933 [Trametes maxima]|nr:hypothetical protein C8Q78DRAFT_406933 [Trametes maxima]
MGLPTRLARWSVLYVYILSRAHWANGIRSTQLHRRYRLSWLYSPSFVSYEHRPPGTRYSAQDIGAGPTGITSVPRLKRCPFQALQNNVGVNSLSDGRIGETPVCRIVHSYAAGAFISAHSRVSASIIPWLCV